MTAGTSSGRDCARALWLLGLTAPVTADQLAAAWRDRIRRAHPDRHVASATRTDAANVMTRALNEARTVIAEWIESGRDWPDARGARVLRFDDAEPWPERDPEPEPAPVCRHTGLRRGDRVRTWPYTGDLHTVAGTERDERTGRTWVLLADAPAARGDLVRLAAFGCPVCGLCAGPEGEAAVRPCPQCLVDLRRLERGRGEDTRVRSAIEARAQAGLAAAEALGDPALIDRARERRRWARRLTRASQDDLHAALLAAFGRAFERWAESAPAQE